MDSSITKEKVVKVISDIMKKKNTIRKLWKWEKKIKREIFLLRIRSILYYYLLPLNNLYKPFVLIKPDFSLNIEKLSPNFSPFIWSHDVGVSMNDEIIQEKRLRKKIHWGLK